MTATYSKAESKDAAKHALRGIFTAFCLPESRRGELDEAGLRHDVRHCIEVLGCGGLYVHGYYANFWLLTSSERRRVLEIVVDEARGRVPIICRCAHASLDEALALIGHAESAGADYISLLGPSYAGSNAGMVLEWFEVLAASTRLGLSVFNTPQAGYVIAPEVLAEVARIENVCALKNHVAAEHTARVRQLVGDSLVVVDPEEERLLTNMVEFGQRAVFTGCNMMYDSARAAPMRDYVAAALDGRTGDATAGFESMRPVRELHHRLVLEPWAAEGRCPVSTVKTWAGLLGMSGGATRRPLPELSESGREELATELERLGYLDAPTPRPAAGAAARQ